MHASTTLQAALLGVGAAVMATSLETSPVAADDGSIVLRDMASFHVGGRLVEISG